MEAPAQGKTARVLVVGDVADLAQLQAKQTAVMKQQAFDAVFCTGGFQQGAVKVRARFLCIVERASYECVCDRISLLVLMCISDAAFDVLLRSYSVC